MTKVRVFALLCLAPAAAYVAVACGGDIISSEVTGPDAAVPETGPTPPMDSGPAPDAPDTGVDSGYDAGLKTDTFDDDLANAMCDSLSRCCFGSVMPGDAGVDGGAFNRDSCLSFYRKFGFQGSNNGAEFKDAGNITLDQAAADDCLKKVKALTCDLPGTEFQAVRAACFGAYLGTIAEQGACSDNIECTPGTYCKKVPIDSDAGVCTKLTPTNGLCGSTGKPALADQECSARQSGLPNHCLFYNFADDTLLPTSEWKCVPPSDVGGGCVQNNWCQNSLCDDNTLLCITPSNFFAPTCANYITK
jgi:hypothetical protein